MDKIAPTGEQEDHLPIDIEEANAAMAMEDESEYDKANPAPDPKLDINPAIEKEIRDLIAEYIKLNNFPSGAIIDLKKKEIVDRLNGIHKGILGAEINNKTLINHINVDMMLNQNLESQIDSERDEDAESTKKQIEEHKIVLNDFINSVLKECFKGKMSHEERVEGHMPSDAKHPIDPPMEKKIRTLIGNYVRFAENPSEDIAKMNIKEILEKLNAINKGILGYEKDHRDLESHMRDLANANDAKKRHIIYGQPDKEEEDAANIVNAEKALNNFIDEIFDACFVKTKTVQGDIDGAKKLNARVIDSPKLYEPTPRAGNVDAENIEFEVYRLLTIMRDNFASLMSKNPENENLVHYDGTTVKKGIEGSPLLYYLIGIQQSISEDQITKERALALAEESFALCNDYEKAIALAMKAEYDKVVDKYIYAHKEIFNSPINDNAYFMLNKDDKVNSITAFNELVKAVFSSLVYMLGFNWVRATEEEKQKHISTVDMNPIGAFIGTMNDMLTVITLQEGVKRESKGGTITTTTGFAKRIAFLQAALNNAIKDNNDLADNSLFELNINIIKRQVRDLGTLLRELNILKSMRGVKFNFNSIKVEMEEFEKLALNKNIALTMSIDTKTIDKDHPQYSVIYGTKIKLYDLRQYSIQCGLDINPFKNTSMTSALISDSANSELAKNKYPSRIEDVEQIYKQTFVPKLSIKDLRLALKQSKSPSYYDSIAEYMEKDGLLNLAVKIIQREKIPDDIKVPSGFRNQEHLISELVGVIYETGIAPLQNRREFRSPWNIDRFLSKNNDYLLGWIADATIRDEIIKSRKNECLSGEDCYENYSPEDEERFWDGPDQDFISEEDEYFANPDDERWIEEDWKD